MLQRVFFLACMVALAQAQKHIVYYNAADECKNELCWQCVSPLHLSIHTCCLNRKSSPIQVPHSLLARRHSFNRRCCLLQLFVFDVRHPNASSLPLCHAAALSIFFIIACQFCLCCILRPFTSATPVSFLQRCAATCSSLLRLFLAGITLPTRCCSRSSRILYVPSFAFQCCCF